MVFYHDELGQSESTTSTTIYKYVDESWISYNQTIQYSNFEERDNRETI